MPLGAIPRVAFGLCLAVLTLPPGILAFCHRNGAPLLVDEGLGFFLLAPEPLKALPGLQTKAAHLSSVPGSFVGDR